RGRQPLSPPDPAIRDTESQLVLATEQRGESGPRQSVAYPLQHILDPRALSQADLSRPLRTIDDHLALATFRQGAACLGIRLCDDHRWLAPVHAPPADRRPERDCRRGDLVDAAPRAFDRPVATAL